MTPLAQSPQPVDLDRRHPSHKTRISVDASSYDEICVRCGHTDRLGSWGKLAEPCPKAQSAAEPWA